MFDEEPDGDPHGECAAEIHALHERIAHLENLLADKDDTIAQLNIDMRDMEREFRHELSDAVAEAQRAERYDEPYGTY